MKNCRGKSGKQKLFSGCLRTENYCYLVHPVVINRKKTLCKYEIKDKIDFVQILSENLYILCREGVLEIYKFRCLKNAHRVKLVYSVNCNSQKITDVICSGTYLFNLNFQINLKYLP